MRAVFVIFLLLFFGLASAQDVNPERLQDLTKAETEARAKEAALAKKRENVQKEISKLRQDLVSVGQEAEKFERQARRLDGQLVELEQNEVLVQSQITGDRRTVARLLAVLQRIENNPPPPMATNAKDAVEAARSARLATSVTGELKIRADQFSRQLEKVAEIRSEISKKQASLAENERHLEAKRGNISSLVSKKTELENSISADQKAAQARVAKLASEAQDLRELIANFETAARVVTPRLKPGKGKKRGRKAGPRTKPLIMPDDVKRFAEAKSSFKSPVQGRIIRQYGKGEKGITMSARSKAQVVSPYAGRIEFAGPFKNYDKVVIMNVGDGYFILLTGLGDIYVKSGEMVGRAEPIGLMPFNTKGTANLYIEFRLDGKTINPRPWLGTALAQAG